jgi:formylglycine-generating enzyme
MRLMVPCVVAALIVSLRSISYGDDPCPAGMRLVDGPYCSDVRAECLTWLDPEDAAARRCKQYGETSCAVPTVHRAFCMAITEHTEVGSRLPMVNVDYYQAAAICKAEGNRMCAESEFSQACGGRHFTMYPTGNERRCDLCNCDHTQNIGTWQHRVDYRAAVDEVAACRSDYGIEALVGNVDEFYTRDESLGPYHVAMKGGHWLPVRNRCFQAATVAHSELYSANTASWRCCHDVSH